MQVDLRTSTGNRILRSPLRSHLRVALLPGTYQYLLEEEISTVRMSTRGNMFQTNAAMQCRRPYYSS